MLYPKPTKPHKKRVIISPAQRERLLKRVGGRCERCHELSDWRGLQFSHVTNRQMGGTRSEYSDEEIEVLCARCHSVEHGIWEV